MLIFHSGTSEFWTIIHTFNKIKVSVSETIGERNKRFDDFLSNYDGVFDKGGISASSIHITEEGYLMFLLENL